MIRRPARSLTGDERASLSAGLDAALRAAGAFPRIVPVASPLARMAQLWRGHLPVLTLGDAIYWPEAPADASIRAADMALLQHELQHVLDYATGRLTWVGYAVDPRNWTYRLPPGQYDWRRLGAEQRAVLTEHLWLAEARGDTGAAEALRRCIPWAATGRSSSA